MINLLQVRGQQAGLAQAMTMRGRTHYADLPIRHRPLEKAAFLLPRPLEHLKHYCN